MPKKGKSVSSSSELVDENLLYMERRITCRIDGEVINVDPRLCFESVFFSRVFLAPAPWPSVNIDGIIFRSVHSFCISRLKIKIAYAHNDDLFADMLEDFDVKFIQKQPPGFLVPLMDAAYELGIKSLLDLTCNAIVDRPDANDILNEKGKSVLTKVVNGNLSNKAMLRYACMDGKIVRVDPRCCYESESVRWKLIDIEEDETDMWIKYYRNVKEGDIGQFPEMARIPSNILEMVNDFCISRFEIMEPYADDDDDLFSDMLEVFDCSFVQKQPLTLLVQLMHAAYELGIKSLLDLTRNAIVDMLDGKSANEILKIFNLPDFTHMWEGLHHREDWAHKEMMIF